MSRSVVRGRFAIALALVCSACDLQSELEIVRARLAALPSVSVVRVFGNDDIFDRAQVGAEIRVQHGVPAMLFGIGARSFDGPSPVLVAQIGRLHPVVFSYHCDGRTSDASSGHQLWRMKVGTSGAIDVGSTGVLASSLSRTFTNVREALTAQDDLVSVIGALPRCPLFGDARTSDGTSYRFCARDCAANGESCADLPRVPPTWVEEVQCGPGH